LTAGQQPPHSKADRPGQEKQPLVDWLTLLDPPPKKEVRMSALPSAKFPVPCVRTNWPGACRTCGAPGASHSPIFSRGLYCPRCCPACAPKPAELRKPAAPPAPPQQPKQMAAGSQWLDLGYGRPRDPFYLDDAAQRAARVPRHRGGGPWLPLRSRWFRGRL
jgi:hypothetical protein